MKKNQNSTFLSTRRLVQFAVLGALIAPAAVLAGDEVDGLINPDTVQFSFGLAHVDNDSQRYGMYNGLQEGKDYAIGGINIVQRNDETGTWARLNASNLGLSTEEIRAEYEKQGQWRVWLDYNETSRVTPYDIHTNLQGIGSNNLKYNYAVPGNTVQAASTKPGINLETKRDKTRLELSRYFSPEVEFKVLFQNEHKKGERIFGRGTSSQQEFLAEPIDYQMRQVDANLNYTGERLQISAGYYGSFFNNEDTALNIVGGATALSTAAAPNKPFSPIALPPDNSAHQFSLMGAYQFTPTTRASLKLARTRAIQNDDFINVGTGCTLISGSTACNISNRDNLGGRVDTTLVDFGLTSRPMSKLSLLAKLRYEERDDKTVIAKYINASGSSDGFNEQRSLTTKSGKLEASYLLPKDFNLTGGVDAERKERNMDGVRVVGYREEVEEMTYKIGLRRALADTLSGSVGYARSDRTGSDFRTLRTWNTALNAGKGGFSVVNPTTGVGLYALGGLLQPIYMADRDRNKVTLALDWMPSDALSFQVNAEKSRDDYESGRQSPADIGTHEGEASLLNIDASYAISDNWKLSAWASRNVTSVDQSTCRSISTTTVFPAVVAGAATLQKGIANCAASTWNADLTSRSDAVGIGMRGKIRSKLNVGADLAYMRDHNSYDKSFTTALVTSLPTTVGSASTKAANLGALTALPDIASYLTTLKLFASYPIGKESSVQLNYTLDHRTTNDWTWTDWRYTDGTTVVQDQNQTTHFLGVTYNYGFR